MILAREFPWRPESVPSARRFVIEALNDYPAPVRETVQLLVSELATNAVRHARSPFTVAVKTEESTLRVEVEDRGEGTPEVQSPAPDASEGRGLQLVQSFTDSWGVEKIAGGRKSVWFSIRVADQA